MRWFLGLMAGLLAVPALAAPSSAPTYSIADATVSEAAGKVTLVISKSGGGKATYSTLWVNTVDTGQTATAGVDFRAISQSVQVNPSQPSVTVSVPIISRAGYQPSRSFQVKIAALRYGAIGRSPATVTITDTSLPPPAPSPPSGVSWTKCADEGQICYVSGPTDVRYGKGITWSPTFQETASFACNNSLPGGDPLVGTVKECDITGIPIIMQTCADGSVIPATSVCPVLQPTTQTCPDGSVIPASQTCPVVSPTNTWVGAPLHDDGFARVKANPDPWDNVGASSRPLVAGELVAIFANGWGTDYAGRIVYEVMALSDGAMGRAYASDLDGVAPVGTPPQLPADWWHPALVTATKTCPGAFGGPGVTQGGIYRAEMLVGTHTSLASGQTGSAGATWTVYAADDPWQGARVVVPGDCLVGQ